jgi:signal transduction histidine kinase
LAIVGVLIVLALLVSYATAITWYAATRLHDGRLYTATWLVAAIGTALTVAVAMVWIRCAPAHALTQLRMLADNAHQLSADLGRFVRRLRHGEHVDPKSVLRPIHHRTHEFGEVSRAQPTHATDVVAATLEEARRENDQTLALGLARRFAEPTRALRATIVEWLRQTELAPDDTRRLYVLEAHAQRIQRAVDNIVLVMGDRPLATHRRPQRMVDVLQAAVQETTDHLRVSFLPVQDCQVAPDAVAELIHVLAELVENATRFSPPGTPVTMAGSLGSHGYCVEIEDRGEIPRPAVLAELTAIARDPDPPVVDAARLGLAVVGRLAAARGLTVTLRPSAYGGTTAIVLIPPELLQDVVTAALQPARGGV